MTEVDISFKVPGKLVERNYDEGDTVAKNAVVARLDRDSLVQQRAQAEASIAVPRHSSRSRGPVSGSDARRSPRTFSRSRADLEAHRRVSPNCAMARGRRRFGRLQPRSSRHRPSTTAPNAISSEREVLHKSDDISTQQYDQFRQRALAADAQLKQARQQQALVQQGPRREQVEQAAANVERSRAAIRLSEANTLDVRRREQDVTARRADIVRLRAQLGQIDVQLEDTIARSPVAGIVLVKSADPGEVIAAGTPVVTIGDIDHPWVRGYHSRDRSWSREAWHAREGDNGLLPGQDLHGKLTFISSQAEFTPRQIQTHGRARQACLSRESRNRQPQSRAEIQHAGRRGDRSANDRRRKRPDTPFR